MSRNAKPDNIVEAFLYIAKRCLTPNEQNDLSEKLRDPRIVGQAPPQQQQYQQQYQAPVPANRGRGTFNVSYHETQPVRQNRSDPALPQPASQQGRGRGGYNNAPFSVAANNGNNGQFGGNKNGNKNTAAPANNQAQGRGRGNNQGGRGAGSAPGPLAVSAGYDTTQPKRNNRRPQPAEAAAVTAASGEQGRTNRRRNNRGQGAAPAQ